MIGSVELICFAWSSMVQRSGIVSHASDAEVIWLRKSEHIPAGSLSAPEAVRDSFQVHPAGFALVRGLRIRAGRLPSLRRRYASR